MKIAIGLCIRSPRLGLPPLQEVVHVVPHRLEDNVETVGDVDECIVVLRNMILHGLDDRVQLSEKL